ncbi:hypothetical protein ACWCP6_16015 [Streptomyces sp. NPDC002004]
MRHIHQRITTPGPLYVTLVATFLACSAALSSVSAYRATTTTYTLVISGEAFVQIAALAAATYKLTGLIARGRRVSPSPLPQKERHP